MKKCFILLVLLIASLQILEAAPDYNSVIKDYAQKGINKQYYAFYFIDGYVCNQCCITSVKLNIPILNEKFKDSIINILVFQEENKMNKTIAYQVGSKNIFFDKNKIFESTFSDSTIDFPALMITNQSGEELYFHNNLRNNPFEIENVIKILHNKSDFFTKLKEYKAIPLNEGDIPINYMASRTIVNDSVFVFIDPLVNMLQYYNYNNGKFVDYEMPPEEPKFYFYDSTKHNKSVWEMANQADFLLSFREVLKFNDECKIYKCKLVDDYMTEKTDDGKENTALNQADAIVKDRNGKYEVLRFDLPDKYIYISKLKPMNKKYIALIEARWDLYEANKSFFNKELPIVALFDENGKFERYLLKYKDIIDDGDMISSEFLDFYTFSENGTLFLITKEYSKCIAVTESGIFYLKPNQHLKNWFESKDTTTEFEDIISNNQNLICIFSNKIKKELTFEFYNEKGEYSHKITTKLDNFDYKLFLTLAIRKKTILLLTLDKKENWFINKFEFE
ncbi:MAG TPA: hypothetical protein PK762_07880 [Candidatus Kapabacteria bacterium]|nr:hypothetical protein [Candidatus Kapabacteria bacterium]